MKIKNMVQDGLITLGACLFFGVTLIAIAGGAIYPPVNRIAKPFVCPNGRMEYSTSTYRPAPGESTTTISWSCIGASGEGREIGMFALVLPAGIIDGLIIFFPIMAIVLLRRYRRGAYSPQQAQVPAQPRAWENPPHLYPSNQFKWSSDSSPTDEEDGIDLQGILSMAQVVGEKTAKIEAVAEDLKGLKMLLDQGLITRQDYDQKKVEILRRL